MKIKTSELDGAVLDWAVAKCEGFEPFNDGISWLIDDNGRYKQIPKYSTDWAQGGPIIEREGICHASIRDRQLKIIGWRAAFKSEGNFGFDSPTPLIAAMRCYVASKLGDEIKVPKGVLDESM